MHYLVTKQAVKNLRGEDPAPLFLPVLDSLLRGTPKPPVTLSYPTPFGSGHFIAFFEELIAFMGTGR